MNCDRAKEMLVDLVYGELAEADRGPLDEHLADCGACRRELESMRLARSLLARGRAGEPAGVPAVPAARAGATWRLWGRRAAAAAAAALVIGAGVWLLLYKHITRGVLAEEPGPVEIKRVGVSLTILSRPDNWPGPFRWDDQVQAALPGGQQAAQLQYSGQHDGQITVNANAQYQLGSFPYRYGWPGLALVRDQRMVRRLKKGLTSVRLTGVPSGILPDTVRLRSTGDPDALTILEQNYQYDLASAAAVLKRHIDRKITVIFRNGQTATGTLLSFDGSTLVIQPPHEGPRNIARSQVRAVAFEKLPMGLLTQPTLVWDLENRAAENQQFEVAYLTYGLNWRADYVLKLRLDGGKAVGDFEVEDTADIVGYATVTNHSGVTYEQAQLKLLAGDVNLIRPPARQHLWKDQDESESNEKLGAQPQFQEKSFFEYHLYTLGRPTTIRNAETKQIELLTGSGIKMRRGYLYDPHRGNKTAVRVTSEFKNSEENNLGKPLPKGTVRLYAPDADGLQQYAARQEIDHTPVNEKVRLLWGFAFDLAVSFKQTNYRRQGHDRHLTWQYDLRNHKNYDVTITVIAHVAKSTYKADCNYPWHVREAGLVEIDVPVKSNSAVKVVFSHSYNNYKGGGLKSPHDKQDKLIAQTTREGARR